MAKTSRISSKVMWGSVIIALPNIFAMGWIIYSGNWRSIISLFGTFALVGLVFWLIFQDAKRFTRGY